MEVKEECATEEQQEQPAQGEHVAESDGAGDDVSASAGDDVSASRSVGVAEFPPPTPTLPLPPQLVVQNFYVTLVAPSTSSSSSLPRREPLRLTAPSTAREPPWRAPVGPSRSAPRQQVEGWCRQCKKPKSVCYKLGDWECPTCGVHNYASKNRCTNRRCPSGAETWCKSCRTWRSICLKDGDWICPSCRNHNYASREVGLAVRYSGFEFAAIVLSGSAG